MLNHITIMGRLTRDPVMRHTQQGTPVAIFALAVERDYKAAGSDRRGVDFVDVVAWRGTGEFACKYFGKGRMAVVEGRLQLRDWTDQDGGKHRIAEIIAQNIYFGDSKAQEPTAAPVQTETSYGASYSPGQQDSWTELDSFRSSGAWQRARNAVRERDCNLCRLSLYHGEIVNADLSVHHIEPLIEQWDRRLDEDNLITLSGYWHERAEAGEVDRNLLHQLATTPPEVSDAFFRETPTPTPDLFTQNIPKMRVR